MNLPTTLYRYIARQFLTWFAGIYFLTILLIFTGDFVELNRRVGSLENIVPVGPIISMAALQLPHTAELALPFATLLAGVLALSRMTRTQELIVARAAGVSVWQFLTPMITLAFIIGAMSVAIFNPISASMQNSYRRLEARVIRNNADTLLLLSSGLWLRQSTGDGRQSVIHAQRVVSQADMVLSGVTIFFFKDESILTRRVDAAQARLEDGHWLVQDGHEWRVGGDSDTPLDQLIVPTNLSRPNIEESFASPDTMSFWDLPGFIELLEQSGFSTQKHQLYFDSLLARPFLLCAMVLVAATFSLRLQRRGGTVRLLIAGVGTGFFVWFMSDVVSALGAASTIPAGLAAWTPSIVATAIGATLLLYLEDG